MTISDPEFQNAGERIEAHYAARPERYAERNVRTDPMSYRWMVDYYTLRASGMGHESAIQTVERRMRDAIGEVTPGPPPDALGTPQVMQGRLWDGTRWIHWRGLSEFSAIHLVRTGQEDELVRRLDRAQAAGRNGIRVLMMKAPQTNSTPAWNAFNLAPSMPLYWEAADRVVELAKARGLYVAPCAFADAQTVMPDSTTRDAFVSMFAGWCRSHPTVLPRLANEPYKNGWDATTDPALLRLADRFGDDYPRCFSIGDPPDEVTDSETKYPLRQNLDTLAQHSSVLVLHPSRAESGQWARWVDHLKGFDEVYNNPLRCYRIHDEPMGAASQHEGGRRDNRPDAHLAAALVCAVMGIGFTLHYISEQDDRVDAIINACALQKLIPASPDFTFRNSGTAGACVTVFTAGIDKIRTCDNGREAWAVGYGPNVSASIVGWASGWTPTVVHQSANVILWKAWK